jgi:endoglucanase
MRKVRYLLAIVMFQIAIFASFGQTMNIRINQIGYYPGSTKIAVVVWSQAKNFEILKVSDSTLVYSGSLTESEYSADAEDSVKLADFSGFLTPGKYFINIPGFGTSLSFEISENVFRKVAYGSLKSYYYQRSSFALSKNYAGVWARAAGHPDTACVFHSSTGRSGKAPSPGGWYDAGDYGKYVINAGISVATLLQIYENFPDYFADSTLIIPESGNKQNDLLDEVKFELDWLKTMQDSDGGVFHKITTASFPGFVMPANDVTTRYFVSKSTGATLDFAAMMAMAGRIYKNYDSTYAADCIKRALRAWIWAKNKPYEYVYSNPSGISTGVYGDSNCDDEFLWAAAELLISTDNDEYKNYLVTNSASLSFAIPGWQNVKGLASLSLATRPNSLDATIIGDIKNSIIYKASSLINEINNNPYRISTTGFYWGSNGAYGNNGVCLCFAYLFTKDVKYIKAAGEIADYLLGRNATAFSFFTLYGHKTPMNIHHRPSGADGIVQPVPGFISGGPNSSNQDGVSYAYPFGPKGYADVQDSYATNEVCINWNAPATLVLAAVDNALGNMQDTVDYQPLTKVDNPPSVTIRPNGNVTYTDTTTINFKATVKDPLGVKKAEFYINSKHVETQTIAPFQLTVKNLPVGTYTFSVSVINSKELVTEKAISITINHVVVGIKSNEKPDNKYAISVSPNPAGKNSTISLSSTSGGEITLDVYDIMGKKLTSRSVRILENNTSQITWNSLNLPARGIYFLVMKSSGKIVATEKVMCSIR